MFNYSVISLDFYFSISEKLKHFAIWHVSTMELNPLQSRKNSIFSFAFFCFCSIFIDFLRKAIPVFEISIQPLLSTKSSMFNSSAVSLDFYFRISQKLKHFAKWHVSTMELKSPQSRKTSIFSFSLFCFCCIFNDFFS